MSETRTYTVVRNNSRTGVTDGEMASFGDKATAIAFARKLAKQRSQLVMLGVMFTDSYDFAVRATVIDGDGNLTHVPVVLREGEAATVEYEDGVPEIAASDALAEWAAKGRAILELLGSSDTKTVAAT